MAHKKINIADKFTLFDDFWSPKVLAESNEQFIKIAKGSGKLVWHNHEHEDELFIVFKGKLKLHIKPESQVEETIELSPGEMFVVPKGMEHCPETDEETHIMIIEPKSTQHTGKKNTERTVAISDQNWI